MVGPFDNVIIHCRLNWLGPQPGLSGTGSAINGDNLLVQPGGGENERRHAEEPIGR